MKAFIGTSHQSWGYGNFQDHYTVIFAETKSVALGLALENYTDTDAEDWTFEEIDPNEAKCHYVSSDGN